MTSPLAIKTLGEEAVTVERFGGKASQLNQLSREQIPVPRALFLPVEWWQETVREKQWTAPFDFDSISHCFQDANAPAALQPLLLASLNSAFFPSEGSQQEIVRLAVRSSSVGEDSDKSSFAGVHDTVLNVVYDGKDTAPVWTAIAQVWASGYSARAQLYREAMGQSDNFVVMSDAAALENVHMGVVIQVMVDAKVAGVLFTKSPISSGNTPEMLLNAAEGLGEGIVSGQVEPDHITITKNIPHTILSQRLRQGFQTPALSTKETQQLLELADKIESKRNNHPQDIEFAWDGTRMWILQTRAITTLGPVHVLTNDMTKDVTPYAVSAMTWTAFSTIISTALQRRYKSVGINYGWEEDKGFYQLARGRIYQSFDVMAGLCRAEFGVAQDEVAKTFPSLTSAVLKQAFPASSRSPALTEQVGGIWRVLAKLRTSFTLCEQLEREIISHTKWCVENDDEKCFLSSGVASHMAAKHAMTLFEQGFERIVEFGAMYMNLQIVLSIFTSVVKMGVVASVGGVASSASTIEKSGQLLASLLVGLGGVITAEQDQALLKLSQGIQSEERVVKFFEARAQSTAADMWQGWREDLKDTRFGQDLNSFLSSYGFRCVNELEVGQARWREDPCFILNMLKLYHTTGLTAKTKEERPSFAQLEAKRKSAETFVLQNTALLKRPLMHWAIERFQRMVRLRENSKAVIVRYISFMRRCLLCVEPHVASILLPSCSSSPSPPSSASPSSTTTDSPTNVDEKSNSSSNNNVDSKTEEKHEQQLSLKFREEQPIFHLCMNDVRALVGCLPLEGESLRRAAHNAQATIRANSARKTRWSRLSAPSVLIRGAAPEGEASLSPSTEGDLLGLAASPGTARGQCCVLLSPEDSHLMVLGGVLVAPITDPAWTPIFLLASAVVVEHAGGVLSHASIVARELGIPAVLGVVGATVALQRTEATVDGSRGRVTRHAAKTD